MAVVNRALDQIPVIDISGLQPEEEIAKQLVDAAATYGFVYVKNQGKDIPIEAIDRIFHVVRQTPVYVLYQSDIDILCLVQEFLQLSAGREATMQDLGKCIMTLDPAYGNVI